LTEKTKDISLTCVNSSKFPEQQVEEEIDVSVVGETLTIKGERKAETEVKEEDYYCCERSYGNFSRSIALPSTVDAKKIEASYEDGILEVSLPKAAEVQPKKISVSAKKKEKTSKWSNGVSVVPLPDNLKYR